MMKQYLYQSFCALFVLAASSFAGAATFTFDSDATQLAIPADGCNTGNSVFKTFVVPNNIDLTQVRVGVNANHTWRGDIQVYLTGPDGNRRLIKESANEASDNYDILLDDTSTNNPNAVGDHATNIYANTVGVLPNGNLDAFASENTVGTWQVEVCDTVVQDVGTFNTARLILDGTDGSATCAAPGAEAVWPFDANTDDIENGHNAVTGTVSISTSNQLVGLGAADFNGLQQITYSDGSFLNAAFTNRTISMFLRPDSTTGNQVVFDEGGGTNGLAILFNGGNIIASVRESGAGSEQSVQAIWPAGGGWHQVAVVYENGIMRLYIDGAERDSVSTGFGALAAHGNTGGLGGPISSGAFPGGSSSYSGLMDDVGYYNSALSASTLEQITTCAGITVDGPPTIAQVFDPTTASIGSTTTLRFTLINQSFSGLTGLNFTATLPTGISLSSETPAGTCFGIAVSANTLTGGQLIEVTDGQLASNQSCTVDFSVSAAAFGSYPVQSSGVGSDQFSIGSPGASTSLTVTPLNNGLQMSFDVSGFSAGNTALLTFTFQNATGNDYTNTTVAIDQDAALWLDSSTLSGSCSGFTVAQALGSSDFTLSGGTVPAGGQCTLSATVRSNTPGAHQASVTGYSTDQTGGLNAPATDTVNVSEALSALCTPGNGASGAIFMNFQDDIYSVNLQTAKATLVTTSNLVTQLNSLAINPKNYLMYYALENGNSGNSTIYFYDLLSGVHGTVAQANGNVFAGMLGGKGLSSGGASFYNGALYLGVEDVSGSTDSVIRVIMSDDGRTARYATRLIDFATGEYGDVVATGGHLHFYVRESSPQFRRYSLADLSEVLNVPSASAVQGGAQRDGATIWNVSNSLGFTNVLTGVITNFKTITTDGSQQVGTAFDAAGCVPTTNYIGDTVWNDSNANGVKDTGETGIANVTVDLYYDINNDGQLTAADDVDGDSDLDTNDRVLQVTTNGVGSYLFSGLTTDAYVVVISDDNGVLTGAAPTFTSSDPNRDAQAVALGLLDLRNDLDFGYRGFIDVRGTVLDDNGAAIAANAHNTVQDTGETGIEGVRIKAFDVATNTELVAGLTDATGNFQLLLPVSAQNSNVRIVQEVPGGFQAVNENIGNSGATNPDTADSEIEFNIGVQFVFDGLVFSNVKQNVLIPTQVATISAGDHTDYPHQFVANSAGDVTFSVVGAAQPNDPWGEAIFHDVNCNNQLDPTEATAIGSPFTGLLKGDSICLMLRVSSPTNAAPGALHTATVSASYSYANTTLVAEVSLIDLTDIGTNALQLVKSVENLTQSGTAGVENQGRPGDVLRYRIQFTNNSSGPVIELLINDSTPSFTFAKDVDGNGTAIECPDIAGIPQITSCNIVEPASGNIEGYRGPVRWQFDGVLEQGSTGTVVYDVQVE
ncbi:Uncharacterised protein [BD1-7 clade bacterium]|uniref:P/Homo B domain-containing protein n=1 Tax=BD1-7 clade bacterium TaxID=2029982 RepID=A0A5S9PSL2_9GAMM|nr:Uncharacterised protein [BD1-7 clade bacterium]